MKEKEIGWVSGGFANYNMRFLEILDQYVGVYAVDPKLNMFDEYEFAFVMPYIVRAGATIRPENVSDESEFLYTISIDAENEEQFYENLRELLALYGKNTFRRSKITFM